MKTAKGFSLLETIIGIIVLAFCATMLNAALIPLASKAIDPMDEIKASLFAKSLLAEIHSKAFDEGSFPLSDYKRCDSITGNVCTNPALFGPDPGESGRGDFDDVDDYHGFTLSGNNMRGPYSSSNTGYKNFQSTVSVQYDGNMNDSYNESGGLERTGKFVKISITTPSNTQLIFGTYVFNK